MVLGAIGRVTMTPTLKGNAVAASKQTSLLVHEKHGQNWRGWGGRRDDRVVPWRFFSQ